MDIVGIINAIDGAVWGPPMIILLLGSHIFLTIRTRVIQRKLPTAIKMSLQKDKDAEGDISQFGALTTALAATIGTGNIVGVATALRSGVVRDLGSREDTGVVRGLGRMKARAACTCVRTCDSSRAVRMPSCFDAVAFGRERFPERRPCATIGKL